VTPDNDPLFLRRRLSRKYPLVRRTVDILGTLWPVWAVQDQDALLDRVETESDLHHFPYGMLLWASGIGLARHLAENPELVRTKRVLELGAGVGLPGIVAASFGATVTQTDYQPDILLLTHLNVADNGFPPPNTRNSPFTHLLGDWREWSVEGEFDLVIGSDLLYEKTLHYPLKRLLEYYSRRGARILLSDPVRPQAMDFVAQLEKQRWGVEMETARVYWEGEEKEVALFNLEAPA
jgi:predicted nicotinamide N-methyase